MWEYLVVSPNTNLQTQLDALGRKGWELVTIHSWTSSPPDMVLKRPMQPRKEIE